MLSAQLTSTKILKKAQHGFTLIELLIVIVILGILASVLITAINPVEQFNKAKDAGRVQAIKSIGDQLDAITQTAQVPLAQKGDGTWWSVGLKNAVNTTNMSALTTQPAATTPVCPSADTDSNSSSGTICYYADTNNNFVVYTYVASNAYDVMAATTNGLTKATCSGNTGYYPVVMYQYSASTGQEQIGLYCVKAAALPTLPVVLALIH
jgi:prepilin-type N-terminal cleavage/methylation domain-containing protein